MTTISELHIRNLALIDDVSLECHEGFSVFTGETGAGKSILIGAIGLLLGERASAEQIRSGADEAQVNGTFSIDQRRQNLMALLDELAIEHTENELIIRRHIQRNGKNKIFINQTPLTLASLRQVGDLLVDLHGQHDHQFLLREEAARLTIDNLPNVLPLWQQYTHAWQELQATESALALHDSTAAELAQRRDVIEFQYNEITSLELKNNEESALEEELGLLSSGSQRSECANAIVDLLSGGEEPISSRLFNVKKHLLALQRFDASAGTWITDFESATTTLTELERFAASYRERSGAQTDPRRLEFINDRIAKIQRLSKKYRCLSNELLQRQAQLKSDLSLLENSSADRSELLKARDRTLDTCRTVASLLHNKRAYEASLFDKAIVAQMQKLGFTGGSWQTTFTPRATPGPYGTEECTFMVRTNPGEPFMPLSRTASGGEISRLMLAIKSVLAGRDSIPILIFDEIDTGIGGTMAKEVATCLKNLSDSHQVFCITHLHQIAALGAQHYQVRKEQDKGRTVTRVALLDEKERISEIARMLGGESAIALRHARELLKQD